MTRYYILENGNESGPEAIEDIVFLVQTGVISNSARIRLSPEHSWISVETVLPATKSPSIQSKPRCSACGSEMEPGFSRCKQCGEVFGVERRMQKYVKMFEDQDRKGIGAEIANSKGWSFAGVAVSILLPGLWHIIKGRGSLGVILLFGCMLLYALFPVAGLMLHIATICHAASIS